MEINNIDNMKENDLINTISSNSQVVSSVPLHEGEEFIKKARNIGFIVYSGVFEDCEIDFYFNLENKAFACLGSFEDGLKVKMTGKLEEENNNVKCFPVWAIRPDSEGWEDASFEEKKVFDLTKNEIIFEGSTLKKKIQLE